MGGERGVYMATDSVGLTLCHAWGVGSFWWGHKQAPNLLVQSTPADAAAGDDDTAEALVADGRRWCTVASGGDGWKVEAAAGGDAPVASATILVTSHKPCVRATLLELGVANEVMDGWRRPPIEVCVCACACNRQVVCSPHHMLTLAPPQVSVWYKGTGPNPADSCFVRVMLVCSDTVEARLEPAAFVCSGKLICSDAWQQWRYTFHSYPPGVRWLYWEDGGRDAEVWAGHYGAALCAASVRVLLDEEVPESTSAAVGGAGAGAGAGGTSLVASTTTGSLAGYLGSRCGAGATLPWCTWFSTGTGAAMHVQGCVVSDKPWAQLCDTSVLPHYTGAATRGDSTAGLEWAASWAPHPDKATTPPPQAPQPSTLQLQLTSALAYNSGTSVHICGWIRCPAPTATAAATATSSPSLWTVARLLDTCLSAGGKVCVKVVYKPAQSGDGKATTASTSPTADLWAADAYTPVSPASTCWVAPVMQLSDGSTVAPKFVSAALGAGGWVTGKWVASLPAAATITGLHLGCCGSSASASADKERVWFDVHVGQVSVCQAEGVAAVAPVQQLTAQLAIDVAKLSPPQYTVQLSWLDSKPKARHWDVYRGSDWLGRAFAPAFTISSSPASAATLVYHVVAVDACGRAAEATSVTIPRS